jgi:hypothetical protein
MLPRLPLFRKLASDVGSCRDRITMGFIRFLLWTSMCIGLGIFVASYEVDGKTPAQHLKQIFKGAPPVAPVVEKMKKQLAAATSTQPTETHSEADRDAVNRLVAKRATK